MATPPHIAVIGAGPAGLIAAEHLARAGLAVTLYDRMPNPARKFLLAGRGGLNLTHSEPLDSFLPRYGDAANWLAPYIRAFAPDDLRAWCEGLGEETFVGSSGRVFPKSMKAAPLLRAWLARLNELGVAYKPRHHWLGWKENALLFADAEGRQHLVTADATLLALGGASWPRLGSDGSWVALLGDIALTPLAPANCGFEVAWSQHFSTRFAGTPLKPVAIAHGELSRQGEAMLTARGIEGGAIYALSAPLRKTITVAGKADITLDLRPDMQVGVLAQKLGGTGSSKSLSTVLRSAGFAPVVSTLLREAFTPPQLAAATAQQLARWLKALPITLTGTAGIARAISTAGGIKQGALTPALMLRAKPGVFAAGEMLDWEAPTGGYLLQACFSTGMAAARGILQYLERK